MHIGFCWESRKGRDHKEIIDISGLIKLKMHLREIWWGSVDGIDLVQDKDQWRALVNSTVNLLFHKMLGHS
jgi:hypothetical protein